MELHAFIVKGGNTSPTVSHLFAAETLLPAAEHLATTMQYPAWATAFIAGQVTECILRALLSKDLPSDPARGKRDLQHDLEALWAAAAKVHIKLSTPPPEWLVNLNRLHSTYQLRYADRYDGFVLPNPFRLFLRLRNFLPMRLVTSERRLPGSPNNRMQRSGSA